MSQKTLYIGLDIETTGLDDDDFILEIALLPLEVSQKTSKVTASSQGEGLHLYLKCPSYEELEPRLNDFVKTHHKALIDTCHKIGISAEEAKLKIGDFVFRYKEKYGQKAATLMIKSAGGVDLPFLNRDFTRGLMQTWFSHRVCDVTSAAMTAVDLGLLPEEAISSKWLAEAFLTKKDVDHRAHQDVVDMGTIYEELLKIRRTRK